MHVLIVQSNEDIATLWKRHLERLGAQVRLAGNEAQALNAIEEDAFDVIVLDVVLEEGSALSVADLAYFRRPQANVVFVTDTTFFSDGSIFNHSANACAFVRLNTPPQDLAAIVEHYGTAAANRDYPLTDGSVHEGTKSQSKG